VPAVESGTQPERGHYSDYEAGRFCFESVNSIFVAE
jgi:hypothetical protein